MKHRISKASIISLIALTAYLCMAVSCDKYRKAGELAKDVAAGVLLAQETEINLHQAGKIDDPTHIVIQQKFVLLADAGIRLDQAINQTHSASSAKDALQAALDAVNDLSTNGLTGIKDKDTATTVKAVLLTVQITLNNIAALTS